MNPQNSNDTANRVNLRDLDFVSPPSLRCHKCRYRSTGFICWSRDGSCMRTWSNKNSNKERSVIHEKRDSIPAK